MKINSCDNQLVNQLVNCKNSRELQLYFEYVAVRKGGDVFYPLQETFIGSNHWTLTWDTFAPSFLVPGWSELAVIPEQIQAARDPLRWHGSRKDAAVHLYSGWRPLPQVLTLLGAVINSKPYFTFKQIKATYNEESVLYKFLLSGLRS